MAATLKAVPNSANARGQGVSRMGPYGTLARMVLTETTGPVEIDVPRGADGSFEPVMPRKCQRRLNGVDEIVLSL